jgi:ankyrin repeat protein
MKKIIYVFLLLTIPGIIQSAAADGEKKSNTHTLEENLIFYTAKGDLTQVQELLNQGASLKTTTKQGSSLLYLAAQAGHLELVKFLCDQGLRSAINEKNQEGGTPLLAAAQKGYFDIVEFLLAHGADASMQVNSGTPLMFAAQKGHATVVDVLVTHYKNKKNMAVKDIPFIADAVKLAFENRHYRIFDDLGNLLNQEGVFLDRQLQDALNNKFYEAAPVKAGERE